MSSGIPPHIVTGFPVGTPDQLNQIIRWVCLNNGLYDVIEQLAKKYPFSSGPVLPGNAANNANSLTTRVQTLIDALKAVPNAIRVSLIGQGNNPTGRLTNIINAWRTARGDGAWWEADNGGGGLVQNTRAGSVDQYIMNDMTPTAKVEFLLKEVEAEFRHQMMLISMSHPVAALFDKYLTTAFSGGAGVSIHGFAS